MHPANEIRPLTGLRFFAALYVLFFHSGSTRLVNLGMPESVANIVFNGRLGVSFFFVLSGFILAVVYNGRIRGRVFDFFRARFARIVPVYFVAFALCAYFFLAQAAPSAVLAEATLLQAWGFPLFSFRPGINMVGWTLSVELFFYLCFPFLLVATSGLSRRAVIVGLIAMSTAIVAFKLPFIMPGVERVSYPFLAFVPVPILRLPEFVSGLLLARLYLADTSTDRRFDAAFLVVGLVTLAFLTIDESGYGASTAATGFGLLIYLAGRSAGPVAAMLGSQFMLLMGGASYAIYLLQYGLREATRVALPAPYDAIAFWPVIMLCSVAVFLWIEEPARRYLRRSRRATQPA